MAEKQLMMVGMTTADTEKRRESYRNLSNLLAENGNSLEWSDHMCASETKKVFQNLKADLASKNEKEVHEAASICVHLLASQSFLTDIDTSGQRSLCGILINILKKSKDRKIMNIVLQSLAKSRLKKEAYLGDLEENFDVLGEILQIKELSPPVLCEALQVVMILFNASPDTSLDLGKSWFPSTFSKLFHANAKVRKSALTVISKVGETIDKKSKPTVRSDLVATVLIDLKDKYCKDMVRMVLSGNFSILQVWREIVFLLGTELHSRRYLINSLLDVVEKAFKVSDPEVRIESFNTWRTIIDNFALDKNTLTNHKKLQLLLAPFRVSNAKTEDTCSTKLHVWWHLVCVLSDKTHLVTSFDQAVIPLLNFCFIGGLPSEGKKGGLTNRNLIMSGALSSPHRAFSSLHTTRAEILAQILATDVDIPNYRHSLPVLGEHVMSSVLFMRYYPLVLKCFGEAIQTLNFSDERQNSLGTLIFSFLLAHIRAVTTPDVQKKEVVDVVRELFSTLSHIESLCQPGDSQSCFLFKFFNLLTLGDLTLPKKVFNSHQFHIPTSGGGDTQDIMCGTLSNHLITQLCHPALLHHSLSGSEFISVWSTVLENSQPVTGKLRFLQAAIQELSASAVPFLCPEHPNILVHLWNVVLKQMVVHITHIAKTSECDDNEPDWSCVYTVLHFPVTHATEAFTCAQFDIFQQIMEMWKKLWNKFTLITSAMPTTEPNSEVEQVASTLLTLCQEKTSDVPDVHTAFYIIIVEFLVVLTESFQYAKLGKMAEALSPSPAKAKKKPHPLHNLGSTMELTTEVFEKICSMVSNRRMYMAERLCQAALSMIKGIQEAPIRYIQEFITHMVKLLLRCVRVNPAVVFDFKVERKCIGMLKSFTGLIEAYVTHKGVTESVLEYLSALDPLFSAAFVSSNKKVKQEVQKLVESIIASISAAGSDIPPFLLEVQTKWGISAPKADTVDDSQEDFVQATPRETTARTAKSLSGLSSSSSSSRVSTPRSSTPQSVRKLKTEESDKNEQDNHAEAVSTPVTRYPVRVRKIEVRTGKVTDTASSAPTSTPATPEDSSKRRVAKGIGKEKKNSSLSATPKVVAGSTVSSDSAVTRVLRASRNAPSPQHREEKHTISQSTSSKAEEKEQNKAGNTVYVAATSQPLNSIEPIVVSSTESEKTPKDSDKANHINGTGSDVEVVSMAPRRSQRNSSVNHSEENSGEDLDRSEIQWKSEESSVGPTSKTHDKETRKGEAKAQKASKEKQEKVNEALCAVLHDTSLEVQKLLGESCVDEETSKSIRFMKAKSDPTSSPHRKSQTVTSEPSENTSQDQSTAKRKRINFGEVVVSPSIIRDTKLVGQKPKVKITNDELKVKDTPKKTVPTSDSEDDELPDVTKPISEKSVDVSEMSNSDQNLSKETLPHKSMAEEQAKGNAAEGSSSGGRRKRKLFSGQGEAVETSVKRRKMENGTLNRSSSFDDSIIEIGSSSPSPEEAPAKKAKETPKPFRKTRSHPGQTDTEKEERRKTKSSFSPKVTRSGRKIVPPNKDMPEPMTPPKKSKRRLHQKTDSSSQQADEDDSCLDMSNSVSRLDESIESLPTEAELRNEDEMEVDQPSADKVNVPENEPKKREGINDNNTKEAEFDFDMSVTIIDSFDASTSKEKSLSSKSKVKETENLKVSSSKTQRDSIEVIDQSSGSTDKDAYHVQDRESSHTPSEETALKKNEMNKSETPKPKSDAPAPEEEEEQPQRPSEKEKGIDVSEDFTDPQKTSDESTPMECGQDLDGEVSYPAARPGTEVLDDSASVEVEAQHKDVNVPSQDNKKWTEIEMMCAEDEEVEGAEDKGTPVPQEELNESEEAEVGEDDDDDKSSSEEDDHEEMVRRESPTSPEPEEEEEEEQEYLSPGQEKEEEEEDNEQEEKEKTKVADVDKMEQETSQDSKQESEKIVPVDHQEKEISERTRSASDKLKMATLSVSKKITNAVIKESELQETDKPADGSQGDQGRDSAFDKEMEVVNDTNVVTSEDVTVTDDTSVPPVKVQEELTAAHVKKSEQQHTTLDETQNETQEENVRVSRNVQDGKETDDMPHISKDSDETDKNVPDNTTSKKGKESLQIASNISQLTCDGVSEAVSSGKESSDSSRKGIQADLTSENIGEVVETVSNPNRNVEALVKSKGTPDDNKTVFSPRRNVETTKELKNSKGTPDINKTVFSPRTNVETTKESDNSKGTLDTNRTVFSPRRNVETTEEPDNSKVTSDTNKTVFSPRRNVYTTKEPDNSKGSLDTNKTVFSPRRNAEVSDIVPDSEKEVEVNEADSRPCKTEAVSSPRRKTLQVKIPVPRNLTRVKERPSSVVKSDHVREAASSPIKVVMATEIATSTPGRTEDKPLESSSDVSNHEVEEAADPKVPQHTERTADTAPDATAASSMSDETSDKSPTSTRQQEEELSPDKSSRSRLNLTVSTPERMKQRGAVMHARSRAALLVACAKKNIKNRGGGESESPASVLIEGGRSRSLGLSPIRRSVPGRPSPGHSPDNRRKSLLDSVGSRPWVKHSPSPGASPSTSILKRTLLNDSLDGDTPSPPPTKYRRVSFADPPVSDRVEIPPSPRTLKVIRAQKRLDMTRMASEVKDSDPQPGEKQVSQEADPEVLDLNNPLCPALITCQDRVEEVARHLTSPAMLPGLLVTLEHMGITTVGHLCKLTEWDISSLPIKIPKVTNTCRVLKEYEKTWQRENPTTSSPVVDEVEVNLAKMFGELDDKENMRPNHQDSAAPEVTKAETEVRESAGSAARTSHSDNIQEIMDMEEITPLYSSPEETEEESLKNLYSRASENDLESQKKLLHHLLQTLPSTDVAEAIAQCIKARMTNVTTTA